jgi:hypothetical protein
MVPVPGGKGNEGEDGLVRGLNREGTGGWPQG